MATGTGHLLRRLSRYTLVFACALGCNGQVGAQESVQDLAYGVTLYHFFQQQYFDALTEVMVAGERGELPHHQTEADLLRGGMSLSYGLDRQAEAVFNQLLDTLDNPAARERAWFYLGKLKYQRRDSGSALAALSHLSADNSGPFSDESHYLQALLLLDQNEIEQARQLMIAVPEGSVWLPYFWFNLGVRLAGQGDIDGAVQEFRRFDQLETPTEELKNLRDRAYTAAGFAYLAAEKHDEARTEFQRVRLNGPLVARALLGYGWVSAQEGNYIDALSPWQELSTHSLLEPAVQESYLAIPFAYEKLGAMTAALDSYQKAADAYENQLRELQSSVEWFEQQPLDGVFDFKRQTSDEWLTGGEILPVSEHVATLSHLISRHQFQMAIKDLRDLNVMLRTLNDARRRLDVMDAVDDDQQTIWRSLINTPLMDEYRTRYEALRAAADRASENLRLAEEENDGRRLASSANNVLWRRLDHAQSVVDALREKGEDVAQESQQLARFRGLMIWQASEDFPAQHWQAKSAIQDLDQTLVDSQARLDKLTDLVNRKHRSAFTPQIAAMRERVGSQEQRTLDAIASVEKGLRQSAVAELKGQQQRLLQYLAQAKLAIARLYDSGSSGGEENPDASSGAAESTAKDGES